MTRIKKIILSTPDVKNLEKYKALRFDRYLIKIDDAFEVPQVKIYGKLRV